MWKYNHERNSNELAHWGTKANHRYIAKFGSGPNAVYIYTPQQLAAYKNRGARMAKALANKAKKQAVKTVRNVRDEANAYRNAYNGTDERGMAAKRRYNQAKKMHAKAQERYERGEKNYDRSMMAYNKQTQSEYKTKKLKDSYKHNSKRWDKKKGIRDFAKDTYNLATNKDANNTKSKADQRRALDRKVKQNADEHFKNEKKAYQQAMSKEARMNSVKQEFRKRHKNLANAYDTSKKVRKDLDAYKDIATGDRAKREYEKRQKSLDKKAKALDNEIQRNSMYDKAKRVKRNLQNDRMDKNGDLRNDAKRLRDAATGEEAKRERAAVRRRSKNNKTRYSQENSARGRAKALINEYKKRSKRY